MLIDVGHELKSVNRRVFGINIYHNDQFLSSEDLRDKVRGAGLTAFMYPGGLDADEYTLSGKGELDRFMNFSNVVGAEEIMFIANFYIYHAPDLAGYWIDYCNQKGYDIKYWEIGDEEYGYWAKGHTTPEEYAQRFIQFSDVIKAKKPSSLVGANIVPWPDVYDNWTPIVLANCGEYVDFVVFNWYPQEPYKESDAYLLNEDGQNLKDAISNVREMINKYVSKDHANEIKIVVGGFNSVSSNPDLSIFSGVHALWLADTLGIMLESEIDMVGYWAVHCYHAGRGGDYGILSWDAENNPRLAYYVFQLYAQHFGDTLVYSSSNQGNITLYASVSDETDGKSLYLVLINKNEQCTSADFSIRGFSPRKEAEVWILNGTLKNEQLPNIEVSTEFTCTLQNRSVTAMKIREQISSSASTIASCGLNVNPNYGLMGGFVVAETGISTPFYRKLKWEMRVRENNLVD